MGLFVRFLRARPAAKRLVAFESPKRLKSFTSSSVKNSNPTVSRAADLVTRVALVEESPNPTDSEAPAWPRPRETARPEARAETTAGCVGALAAVWA